MISDNDLLTYALYIAACVICVIKVGLLVRVRTALFDLPPAQRGLVTILADNNLVWCLTMAIVGGTIVGRVLGFGNTIAARFVILGFLVVGSAVGLIRLGNWFLFPERIDRSDRGRSASSLTIEQEIARLRLLLEREQRQRGEGGE